VREKEKVSNPEARENPAPADREIPEKLFWHRALGESFAAVKGRAIP